MVFPRGLLHFVVNGRDTAALVFATLNSENPGVQGQENARTASKRFTYGIDSAECRRLLSLTLIRLRNFIIL
ncbi:putative rmlC-like jelly roll protein [Rosa chinensis]|uniref:Putative rmlC-like jelly roll protein n=1 Tax=Rosa chinensis TaxID=74649 RepID=A0A2P6RPX4_ROSCH|nr:putative rmlC-like jelly roll protein [Rosa chinensis]